MHNLLQQCCKDITRDFRGKSCILTVMAGKYLLLFTLQTGAVSAGTTSMEERLQEMEQRLSESIQLIEQLSAEITSLKQDMAKAQEVTDSGTEQNDRLNELEYIVDEMSEKIVGDRAIVKAFDAASLDIGGFAHSAFTSVVGEDKNVSGFNRQIFELLLRANLNNDWSAFFAQAFVRESAIQFDDDQERRSPTFRIGSSAPLVIAWANYRHSDLLNVQFGRFITPHGIINIEHFPAILLDSEQPQFLRPFGGQTIFPNFVNGVNLHGNYVTDRGSGNMLRYNGYVSTFTGNGDDLVSGGRISHTWGNPGITIGANYNHGTRSSDIDSDYHMYGFDLFIDKGRFLWKSEVFFTKEDHLGDRLAYYIQPAWRLTPKWTVFYRYDFLDNGENTGDTVENMFGINYTPLSNIRLRATFTHRHFEAAGILNDADALIYQLSATVSF